MSAKNKSFVPNVFKLIGNGSKIKKIKKLAQVYQSINQSSRCGSGLLSLANQVLAEASTQRLLNSTTAEACTHKPLISKQLKASWDKLMLLKFA